MAKRPRKTSTRIHFLHAPPLRGKRPSKRRALMPPFAKALPWQCSVYYWWWAYLRCHEGYRETCEQAGQGRYAQLYADFGDVRPDDFWAWWKQRGVTLFAEPASEVVVQLAPGATASRRGDVVTVQIPLELPLRYVNQRLKKLMGERQKAYLAERMKSQGISRARYPVAKRANLAALYQDLTAWRLKQQHPDWPLYALGFVMRNITDPVQRSDTHVRVELTNDVARRLRRARELIGNVGLGLFPLIGEPKQVPKTLPNQQSLAVTD